MVICNSLVGWPANVNKEEHSVSMVICNSLVGWPANVSNHRVHRVRDNSVKKRRRLKKILKINQKPTAGNYAVEQVEMQFELEAGGDHVSHRLARLQRAGVCRTRRSLTKDNIIIGPELPIYARNSKTQDAPVGRFWCIGYVYPGPWQPTVSDICRTLTSLRRIRTKPRYSPGFQFGCGAGYTATP